ncbi:DinB superfamily protein [Neorhodopirellula lusitana]|uniref:DinB superfamily protein n=1 Tax=Neorhodopirellula lusitana TaxID=445327 RepID=A0ABY1Q584_9BACT|nr:DinB family protein [Neorhodopirellula lusitana]SMP58844.1 DinB superfamily protein [Neorhodopirellula lusitana]
MIGPIIADSAKMSIGYIERLLKDIQPDQFARFASVGGTLVQSNHPAFILGHLSIYPSRIVEELGGDASSIEPSEKYLALFSKDATCLDDPDNTLYPPMDEVVAKFFAAHQAAIDAVLAADDSALTAENPNERMRAKFATKGGIYAFYLGGHTMLHVGQFSAWRRMQGLGPA